MFRLFFTNRRWVFKSYTSSKKEFVKQICSFLSGRIVTLILEEGILLIFITMLDFPSMIVKIVAQIVVIILNYVISKKFVF